MEACLSDSRPDGFILFGKLGIDLFSASGLLHSYMKNRLQLIEATPNCNVISDNPNVCLEIVDCSLYTRHIDNKDDYHRKILDMFAEIPVEGNYLKTLTKIFIALTRQSQVIQENIFSNPPVCWLAFAMNKNSAFKGSYAENPFRYQQVDIRQVKTLKIGQPNLHFDAVDICRLYLTTQKETKFQDDIPSIRGDNFKNQYVLVLGLTAMQVDTDNCH